MVDAAHAGQRLDQLLPLFVEGLSRRRARVLIDLGGVFVDRHRVKRAGRPMREGEKVVAHLGGALERATGRTGSAARQADEARLPPYTVVFEDRHLVVVDKPAGLLTAPTPESDRNNLLALLARRPGAEAVHLVHRLDLPTSGLVLFAKTERALSVLAECFRTHALERHYLGLVTGAFPTELSTLEMPVGGRPARTHVDVLERLGTKATLVRCRLETGRTHQIRIHCQKAGHPVLGDRRYGQPTGNDPPRLALHATHLGLPHPVTQEPLAWDSPWPEDLAAYTEKLRVSSAP